MYKKGLYQKEPSPLIYKRLLVQISQVPLIDYVEEGTRDPRGEFVVFDYLKMSICYSHCSISLTGEFGQNEQLVVWFCFHITTESDSVRLCMYLLT